MATRKRKDDDRRDDRDDRDDGGGDDPRAEEASAVALHAAYLEHRLAGGEPGDAAAYRRGLEQFERLPGAVPTRPAAAPTPPAPDDGGGDADNTDDSNEGGAR